MQQNTTLQIHYNHAYSLNILQTAGKTLVNVAAHSQINFQRKSNVVGTVTYNSLQAITAFC